jgi:hypothetical protein
MEFAITVPENLAGSDDSWQPCGFQGFFAFGAVECGYKLASIKIYRSEFT